MLVFASISPIFSGALLILPCSAGLRVRSLRALSILRLEECGVSDGLSSSSLPELWSSCWLQSFLSWSTCICFYTFSRHPLYSFFFPLVSSYSVFFVHFAFSKAGFTWTIQSLSPEVTTDQTSWCVFTVWDSWSHPVSALCHPHFILEP